MRWMVVGWIAVSVTMAVLVRCNRDLRAECDRQKENVSALMSETQMYKTSQGKNAASVQRLELTKAELEENRKELVGVIASLNVKLKRLQSVSEASIGSNYIIDTVVRDSIVVREKTDTLTCVDYKDGYISLSACVDGGRFVGEVETYDTIVAVVHRVPKRFLFFRFGTKAVRLDVVSKNPYSRITYSEYVELKK